MMARKPVKKSSMHQAAMLRAYSREVRCVDEFIKQALARPPPPPLPRPRVLHSELVQQRREHEVLFVSSFGTSRSAAQPS